MTCQNKFMIGKMSSNHTYIIYFVFQTSKQKYKLIANANHCDRNENNYLKSNGANIKNVSGRQNSHKERPNPNVCVFILLPIWYIHSQKCESITNSGISRYPGCTKLIYVQAYNTMYRNMDRISCWRKDWYKQSTKFVHAPTYKCLNCVRRSLLVNTEHQSTKDIFSNILKIHVIIKSFDKSVAH